jgi:hypothetical protein
MVLFAGIVFFLALIGIIALFAVKFREVDSGVKIGSEWRSALDAEALHVKDLLSAAELDLKKVVPLILYWGHVAIHRAALEFARLARAASSRAHRLADFVSHKRNFRRGETRSEFLKKIAERKNASGTDQDNNGQEEFRA